MKHLNIKFALVLLTLSLLISCVSCEKKMIMLTKSICYDFM